MEIRYKGQDFEISPDDPNLKTITIDTSRFEACPYEYNKTTKFGFFEVIHSGTLTLLSKSRVEVKMAGRLKSEADKSFVREADEFYVRFENGRLHKLDRPRDLINNVKVKKEELSDFISKNRISFRDKNDVTRMAEFYNSLFAR